MRVAVITPPAAVVTLTEAKAHLRVEHDDDDALITGLIAAATGNVDGPTGWLGRALATQTLELRSCDFPIYPIALPYEPIQSVTSVKYLDASGADTLIDPTGWRLLDGNRLQPAFGGSWPSARWDQDSVRIRYVAGYGEPAAVPEPIKTAIKFMVARMYERRGEMLAGTLVQDPTAEALLAPFRIWSF